MDYILNSTQNKATTQSMPVTVIKMQGSAQLEAWHLPAIITELRCNLMCQTPAINKFSVNIGHSSPYSFLVLNISLPLWSFQLSTVCL